LNFSSVGAPWWYDRPAIIVGAGPSLKGFDFNKLKGLGYIVAVNGAMFDLPFADAWITIDPTFIKSHVDFLGSAGPPLYLPVPAPETSVAPDGKFAPIVERAIYLKRIRREDKLSTALDTIECGGTSGFAALNLAYLKRARDIVLFGFDYTLAKGSHYNDEHYPWWKPGHHNSYWPGWAKGFRPVADQLAAEQIYVANASPDSAIDAFDKITHEQALEDLELLADETERLSA
jgi:hypothetical protein